MLNKRNCYRSLVTSPTWPLPPLYQPYQLQPPHTKVREVTMEQQRLDYEKQIQGYKEKAETLENQLSTLGDRDKKELADENHALRELVRALQSKVIKMDDKRKLERKDRKVLQQNYDTAVNDHLQTQIVLKETEATMKASGNHLIETQNQVLPLSSCPRNPPGPPRS